MGLTENQTSIIKVFDGDEEPQNLAGGEGVVDEVCGDQTGMDRCKFSEV